MCVCIYYLYFLLPSPFLSLTASYSDLPLTCGHPVLSYLTFSSLPLASPCGLPPSSQCHVLLTVISAISPMSPSTLSPTLLPSTHCHTTAALYSGPTPQCQCSLTTATTAIVIALMLSLHRLHLLLAACTFEAHYLGVQQFPMFIHLRISDWMPI